MMGSRTLHRKNVHRELFHLISQHKIKAEVLEQKRRKSGGFKGKSGGKNPLKSIEAEKRSFFSLNI